MGMEWKVEDPSDSCKAIIHFIEMYYASDISNDSIRNALLEDLCSKAQSVTTSDRSAMLARAMYYSLPSRLRELYPEKNLGLAQLTQLPPPSRRRKSVGIITVIDTELEATLRIFEAGAPSYRDGEFEYWFSEIDGYNDSHLSIVISNVGQARNVPCAIAVDHLLSHFPSDLMMLIGIAAGPPAKVKLGDVVVAHRVYDYEHVRAEILQKKKVKSPRPLFLELDPATRLDLNKFTEKKLRQKFDSVIRMLDVSVPISEDGPALHTGTVAAGEMLIADGSLDEMRVKVDNEIRAGDQEDSGFVQACRLSRVPWCIFRGISDYGDPEKDKTWQFAAALAAASAGYSFLKDCYKSPHNRNAMTNTTQG